ncbi:YceI family protein [uncultured Thiodictyon sp.]|uniref:YceI family protein n=1 Tax=uncultured Thiodictyon sp. TaxID=1846217 RepID=UPI0026002796|nr:YceI family protein [uncultured Thiodictyon sp.]
MKRLALALSLAAALAPTAHAIEYTKVQADQSSITFSYTQMGVTMDGRFKDFTNQLSFDPAQPTNAKATIEVALASIDTGTAEGDDEVAGKSWFNTKAFPTARFESSSVKAVGDNRYEVAGKLTIKGQTREVVVPASLTPQGNAGVFAGTFTIRRGDFSIGEGSWSTFDIVANDIQIRFEITALSGNP